MVIEASGPVHSFPADDFQESAGIPISTSSKMGNSSNLRSLYLKLIQEQLLTDLFPRVLDITPSEIQPKVNPSRSLKDSASDLETTRPESASKPTSLLAKQNGPDNFGYGLDLSVPFPNIFKDLRSMYSNLCFVPLLFFWKIYDLKILKESGSKIVITLDQKVKDIFLAYNTVGTKTEFIDKHDLKDNKLLQSLKENFNDEVRNKITNIIKMKKEINNTFLNRVNLITLIVLSLLGKYNYNAFLNYKKSLLSLSACLLFRIARQFHVYRSNIGTINTLKDELKSNYDNLQKEFTEYTTQISNLKSS